ncbi:MFS transporter [Pseudomonas matsuisoli]|uniref:MFS transporter n=1 Tax=Pseudomonas matsuisoli TaxID=1515666 RepID=A0A917PM67_9PSED|nr:MFS transporter [Pseudomonas matsuisoli]GGJ83969.1 MFS transporter [Pseudomonas matsuisoli]
MPSLLLPISSLLCGVALLLLGNGLLNTLLTVRGSAEGYSSTLLGLAMSGYFVGFLVGIWIARPLIRRVGHIRVFAFYAALAAATALMHVLVVDIWVWMVLRVLYGIALVTLYTVVESWLNAQTPGEQRGQVFAIYMVVNLGSLALAQQLLQLDDPLNFTLFAVAAVLICCAVMPLAITRQAQPPVPDTPHTNLRHLFNVAPIAVVASLLSGLALGAFWGMAPVYAGLQGFSASDIGTLMSVTILGGAVLQLPIGRLSDRFDRRTILIGVVALATVVSVLIALLSEKTPLMAMMFLFGGLSFAIYPIAMAQLIDQLNPEEILSGSSGLLMLNGAGSAVGPLLAGVLMDAVGPTALPLYFALMLGLLLAYALYRRRHVTDLVSGNPGHFVPMVRTSHTVLELMPDAPHDDESAQEPMRTAS